MQSFVSNFKWVMLVTGLITCTMFIALVDPSTSIKSNFGVTLEDPLAQIIVRSWGALIGLMGIMLIYGAFNKPVRNFSLIIVGAGKIIFIILVLSLGKTYLNTGAGMAVIVDSIIVVLFIVYLILSRNHQPQ